MLHHDGQGHWLDLGVDPVTFPCRIVRDLLPAQGKLQLYVRQLATETAPWRKLPSDCNGLGRFEVAVSLPRTASTGTIKLEGATELQQPRCGKCSQGLAMFTHARPLAALWAAAALSWPCMLGAAEHNPVAREPRNTAVATSVDLIVKLRPEASMAFSRKASAGADRSVALAKRTGLSLSLTREISTSMLATQVELGDASADEALRRLQNDSQVEYVAFDRKRFVSAVPTDPLFAGQWYLQAAQASSVNATGAWDLEVGAAGAVVAVLDTGVLYDHPDLGRADLGGKLLPGYDFISGTAQANDGNGRDADPSDPGDWINDSDKANSTFSNCDVTGSSWHGTRVAGVIGALT